MIGVPIVIYQQAKYHTMYPYKTPRNKPETYCAVETDCEIAEHVAIQYVEIVSLNHVLNDKHIQHQNNTTMIPFDQNGRIPDGCIKVTDTVLNHARA